MSPSQEAQSDQCTDAGQDRLAISSYFEPTKLNQHLLIGLWGHPQNPRQADRARHRKYAESVPRWVCKSSSPQCHAWTNNVDRCICELAPTGDERSLGVPHSALCVQANGCFRIASYAEPWCECRAAGFPINSALEAESILYSTSSTLTGTLHL